jgi:hypothetical protein
VNGKNLEFLSTVFVLCNGFVKERAIRCLTG